MPVTPSPNRSRPPAFHELDDETFEDLTCALFAWEPGVITADRYGAARDAQYGIDILARCTGDWTEVASCKCYKTIKKGDIEQWSTDFLNHWDSHWKDKKVRRFVLAVATLVNSTERNKDIDRQKKRFQSIGVEYEVWGPHQLQEKLRSQRGIVSQYLGPEWESRLCGVDIEIVTAPSGDEGTLSHLVVSQLASLQAALSEEVEKGLDGAMAAIRSGNLRAVEEQLVALRGGAHWMQLRATTQARIVRLQGSVCLQRGDLDGAESCSEEADAIASPDEPRLRALLVARRHCATEGLRVLGDPVTRDGVQLKLALLLEANNLDEARALLETHERLKEPSAETERLRALVELSYGRHNDAMAAIQRAEQMEPRWPAISRTGAIVRYALALSPLATSDAYLGLNPIDLDLVREDDEARAYLNEALVRFDRLSVEATNAESRTHDEMWALACLANLHDRVPEAEARCCNLLARCPTHALALTWALARGLTIDRTASIHALQENIALHHADAQQALVLALLLDAEGQPDEAERVL